MIDIKLILESNYFRSVRARPYDNCYLLWNLGGQNNMFQSVSFAHLFEEFFMNKRRRHVAAGKKENKK